MAEIHFSLSLSLLPSLPLSLCRFNSSHETQAKQHAQDIALTKAKVKKLELQVESLQRSLEEKVGFITHTHFSSYLHILLYHFLLHFCIYLKATINY